MTVYNLVTPISEEEIRKVRTNDVLYITGTIVTARDQAHRRALNCSKEGKPLPINLEGLAVFHCGPIVRKEHGKWTIVAAGPTTSTRMEKYESEFIKEFNVRVIIGKGGMGMKTTEAMKNHGAVYGAFTGGAAILAAKAIGNVRDVHWYDLGMPEAMWVLEVKDFGPLAVAIDSHGDNLFENIRVNIGENKDRIYKKLGL